MKKSNAILIIILLTVFELSAQGIKKMPRYFGETFKIDSVNLLLLTVQYNSDLYSDKFSFTDYYGNLIFFDYTTNNRKRLFEKDTYIKPFRERNYYYRDSNQNKYNLPKNISEKYIFLFVYNTDFDNNKKITSSDPATLYICDLTGNNLKPISPKNENAVSFELFNEKGFMLVRMQRDYNNDKDFTYKDKDFYYLIIDLKTLEVATKIELQITE